MITRTHRRRYAVRAGQSDLKAACDGAGLSDGKRRGFQRCGDKNDPHAARGDTVVACRWIDTAMLSVEAKRTLQFGPLEPTVTATLEILLPEHGFLCNSTWVDFTPRATQPKLPFGVWPTSLDGLNRQLSTHQIPT